MGEVRIDGWEPSANVVGAFGMARAEIVVVCRVPDEEIPVLGGLKDDPAGKGGLKLAFVEADRMALRDAAFVPGEMFFPLQFFGELPAFSILPLHEHTPGSIGNQPTRFRRCGEVELFGKCKHLVSVRLLRAFDGIEERKVARVGFRQMQCVGIAVVEERFRDLHHLLVILR